MASTFILDAHGIGYDAVLFGRWRKTIMKNTMIGFLVMAILVGGGVVIWKTGGGKTIDASTDESFKKSIEEVRDDLDPEERDRFDEALKQVMFSNFDLEQIMSGTTSGESLAEDAMRSLDGLTAEQVIKKEEQIAADRQRRGRERAVEQREQIEQEIHELEEKVAQAQADRENLERFDVIRSRYYQRDNGVGMKQPVIELTVRNDAEHAISRAHFRGVLATPGRAIPWIEEDFNYQIRGGLEPGEEATWSLAPNMFSNWGTVEVRDDMVFTVETVRLDGPDGETLYSSMVSERDRDRLESLRRRLQEIEE